MVSVRGGLSMSDYVMRELSSSCSEPLRPVARGRMPLVATVARAVALPPSRAGTYGRRCDDAFAIESRAVVTQ